LSGDGNRRRHRPSLRRQGALALALISGGFNTPFAAAPANHNFRVTVTLNQPLGGQGATCANVLDPATNKVTIACGANPPVPTVVGAEAPRYLLHVYRAGEWLVDDQMGNGTLTSWRIVHVANREYLEMTVGW
jgi:hypothetical protein